MVHLGESCCKSYKKSEDKNQVIFLSCDGEGLDENGDAGRRPLLGIEEKFGAWVLLYYTLAE
jgi:hypothetical protein